MKYAFLFFILLSNLQPLVAQAPDSIKTGEMPQIEVLGLPERLLRLPGSASIIGRQAIQQTSPVSGNEVFRKVNGLNVVDEEGVGMRANIGIRGLDPDRSRTVLVMEDGIPVALSPYGEPELYYTPSIDRMSGIEVLKGSGSILFGPQTIGGVINYLTANPPPVPTTEAVVRGGEGGFFVGRFSHGSSLGNSGYNVTYLRKSGNGVGILDYGIHDLNAKFKHVLSPKSVLGIKFGVYDEVSNSTYVGITQNMYDSGLYDYVHPAPDDQLTVRRYSLSATHDHFFTSNIRLKTTVFGYTTTRDWSRQDFNTSPQQGVTYVRTLGDLYFRDRTGNRNRSFEVVGVEPRFSSTFDIASYRNELDFGFRYVFERAYEKRIDGTTARPTSGTLREDEVRTGTAYSAFVQDRVFVTDDLTVTPGIRLEHFSYERDIYRLANAEVSIVKGDQVTSVIPGVGVSYQIGQGSSVFAGIHRGFSPPRVKDAISNGGVSAELDAETSWNSEVGFRGGWIDGLNIEVTGFHMDFSNQIIPVSESSGGTGVPGAGLVNGGRTRHIGVETGFSAEIDRLFSLGFSLDWNVAATFTQATFSSDRFVDVEGSTVNVNGNTLPYAPEILLNSSVQTNLPFGFQAGFNVQYTGRQFGDVLNKTAPSADGQEGLLDAFFVMDANVNWTFPGMNAFTMTGSMKNLTDERYIASRRPQGIRLGLPRFMSVGLEVRL